MILKSIYLLLISILFINQTYAQDSYTFDTLLKYNCKFVNKEKDTITTQYIISNSKDNSYFITVREENNIYYSLHFIDYKKITSKVNIRKQDFFEVSTINITNCYDVSLYKNKYKYQTKNYDFINLKDTIINNDTLKVYKSIYLKSDKKKKKNNLGSIIYVVKKDTEHHLPILRYSTTYNEWLENKNIPNGIHQEYIFTNYEDKITNHFKLVDSKKINLTLKTVKPCPPTVKISKRH